MIMLHLVDILSHFDGWFFVVADGARYLNHNSVKERFAFAVKDGLVVRLGLSIRACLNHGSPAHHVISSRLCDGLYVAQRMSVMSFLVLFALVLVAIAIAEWVCFDVCHNY